MSNSPLILAVTISYQSHYSQFTFSLVSFPLSGPVRVVTLQQSLHCWNSSEAVDGSTCFNLDDIGWDFNSVSYRLGTILSGSRLQFLQLITAMFSLIIFHPWTPCVGNFSGQELTVSSKEFRSEESAVIVLNDFLFWFCWCSSVVMDFTAVSESRKTLLKSPGPSSIVLVVITVVFPF